MKENLNGLSQALRDCWVSSLALIAAVVAFIHHDAAMAGCFLTIGAIGAMNGLMKTELALAHKGPTWWKEHAVLRVFHHITNEGELAGIAVGLLAGGMLISQGHHVHLALSEGFTLLGIMSMANLVVRNMTPVMRLLERVGGPRLVIVGGSLLSSFTGEPAAAVFLGDYFKKRCKVEDRARVATGLALTIGSGGGLMYFAAPPILIVWGVLNATFGWSLWDLITLVGGGCVAHVLIGTSRFVKYIRPATKVELNGPVTFKEVAPLMGLGLLVVAHLLFAQSHVLWVIDAGVAGVSWRMAQVRFAGSADHEAAFTAKWQPLILASLLLALEVIGEVADPFIGWLGGFIPTHSPVLGLAVVTFFVTAVTSHFADNALASRVFMTFAASLIPVIGLESANLVAASVVMGALFGGFVTIPGNLPNFYLARVFNTTSGEWIRRAFPMYVTVLAYLGWLTFRWAVM